MPSRRSKAFASICSDSPSAPEASRRSPPISRPRATSAMRSRGCWRGAATWIGRSIRECQARLDRDATLLVRVAPDLRRHQSLHRDHVLYELIDGDLGALLPTRCFVLRKLSLIPVQGRKDVASAGAHGLHRHDGGDRNVVEHSGTIAWE